MQFVLRAATSHDSWELAELHRACLPQEWLQEDFRQWIAREEYRLIVAETQQGQLAGYAVARVLPPEGELLAVAVTRDARRQGLARALLLHLMSTQAQVSAWFLEVSSRNESAQAFYAALGFIQIGIRARYYPDGSDALSLRCVR